MDRETLLKSIAEYSFFQTIDLGDGIKTPGRPTTPKQKQVLALIESMNLDGKRAIDIGCANGLFAFAAEKRGASEVLAVDHTKNNIECLEKVLIPHLNSNVKAMQVNVLDLDPQIHGTFDLVIFSGVLYHLRYPFWALKIIREILNDGGTLILETGIHEDFNRTALMYCPKPADSPQSSRGGNACTFFNEKALYETLAFFGMRHLGTYPITKPLKRTVKKLVGVLHPTYNPISNVVFHYRRDFSLDDEYLIQFYESTTE